MYVTHIYFIEHFLNIKWKILNKYNKFISHSTHVKLTIKLLPCTSNHFEIDIF